MGGGLTTATQPTSISTVIRSVKKEMSMSTKKKMMLLPIQIRLNLSTDANRNRQSCIYTHSFIKQGPALIQKGPIIKEFQVEDLYAQ